MKILVTAYFFGELKKLKRKFPNLKDDIISTLKTFNPKYEIHVGKSIYKIRVASQDTNKGKSGGLRSYVYLYRNRNLLVPICIYPKSEKENLGEGELQYHFQKTLEELLKSLITGF